MAKIVRRIAWNVTVPCPAVGMIVALLAVPVCVRTAAGALPEAYAQRWRDPKLAARIEQNIEKHRKGDAVFVVVDSAGRPIEGAKVEFRQTGHEFLFGCNAFVLGQLATAEENERYEQAFLRLFNFVTVPFYWQATEPTRGELRYAEGSRDIWRRPPPDRFVPWAKQHGLTLKGHPLLWHAHNPPWLPNQADALRELYRNRFREIAERYEQAIPIFDVVNESLVCPNTYPLFTPDRHYVRWAFEEAARCFPSSTILMINEVTEFNFQPFDRNPYVAQIRQLLADGAAVRGIGLQYHFFRRAALDAFLASPRCDPAALLDLYEAFAQFKLPLYITEITIPSAGTDGEALQAEVVCDHYRLWFSAPTMAGITWWNLGDGTAVQGENEAQGGLLDQSLKPKAAYHVLDELINKRWKTTAEGRTNAQGRTGFRGFFGKYTVRVSLNGRSREFHISHSLRGSGEHRLVFDTKPQD